MSETATNTDKTGGQVHPMVMPDFGRIYCPRCENQCSDICDACDQTAIPFSNFKRQAEDICEYCRLNPVIEIASGCRLDGLGVVAVVLECPKFKGRD